MAVRVIPCLDIDKGRVVKGVRFQELRDAGDPVECARAYESQGADGRAERGETAVLADEVAPAALLPGRRQHEVSVEEMVPRVEPSPYCPV